MQAVFYAALQAATDGIPIIRAYDYGHGDGGLGLWTTIALSLVLATAVAAIGEAVFVLVRKHRRH